MSKSKVGSVIALEIEKYEKKIAEFQNYLELNKIGKVVFDDLYKEIEIQIKIMAALPIWLNALKTLKEDTKDKPMELRGGAEINDVARLRMENK